MDPIQVKYTRGDQFFIFGGKNTNLTLLDFWAWAYSDIYGTNRGVLAEFIVAQSLGLNTRLLQN